MTTKTPKVQAKKIAPKVSKKKPNERALKMISKYGKSIAVVVVSPLGKDKQPKSWTRKPWSTSFVSELAKGSYRLRLLDKERNYLATVTLTK